MAENAAEVTEEGYKINLMFNTNDFVVTDIDTSDVRQLTVGILRNKLGIGESTTINVDRVRSMNDTTVIDRDSYVAIVPRDKTGGHMLILITSEPV